MFIFFQFIKLPQKKLHCFTEISELLFAFNCISISRSSQAMNCLQPFSNFHVQLTKIFTLQILSFKNITSQKHYQEKLEFPIRKLLSYPQAASLLPHLHFLSYHSILFFLFLFHICRKICNFYHQQLLLNVKSK